MAKMRYVNTKFWDDNFIAELEPDEKLLFLYLITNPLTDVCGGYEISFRRIDLDTGIEKSRILKILEKFEASERIFFREGWVFIKNFIRHQNWKSEKIKKGIMRSLMNCPQWIRDMVSITY